MKNVKKFGLVFIIFGVIFSTVFFIKSNKKDLIIYETTQLIKTSIETKIVATGKVIPEDEVEIKPQIAGIVDKILVQEGDKVKAGDLLLKIKVVPDEQALNNAEGRVENAKIVLENTEIEFLRNKKLFTKGIISEQEFNRIELEYSQAQQNLKNLESDLQIIKLGSSDGSSVTNTNVRATVTGTILEIPVKKGDQVIQANTFNPGTTIATIADLNVMIFLSVRCRNEILEFDTLYQLKAKYKNFNFKITLSRQSECSNNLFLLGKLESNLKKVFKDLSNHIIIISGSEGFVDYAKKNTLNTKAKDKNIFYEKFSKN